MRLTPFKRLVAAPTQMLVCQFRIIFLASGKSKGLGSFSSKIMARRPAKGRIAEFLPALPLTQMPLSLSKVNQRSQSVKNRISLLKR